MTMSTAYTFGMEAEKRAAAFYHSLGFHVLAQNYRYRKAEVDLIAQQDNLLVAVEVKARSTSYFGSPQSFVSKKKIRLLVMAIDAYIQQHDLQVEVRFDIISYTLVRGKWELEHLPNAFYAF